MARELQGRCRLSESLIWRLPRAFYVDQGMDSWKPKGALHRDLAFELARISMAMKAPDDARRYREESLALKPDSAAARDLRDRLRHAPRTPA